MKVLPGFILPSFLHKLIREFLQKGIWKFFGISEVFRDVKKGWGILQGYLGKLKDVTWGFWGYFQFQEHSRHLEG